MDQLKKLYQSLGLWHKVSILLVLGVVGGGVFGLTYWQKEKSFQPLYKELAAEDAAAVVAKLKEKGIDYRLGNNGSTVLIPAANAAEVRLALAGSGLPKSGRPGFELFDKINFGVTDFAEQVNYRRALEGELERSVGTMGEVESARVHVTFRKDSVYLESRQPAKASVIIRLRSGARLTAQNVQAVTYLVASAVDGLQPEAVSVLDVQGNLLSRPRRSSSSQEENGEGGEVMLEYRQRIEKDLLAKLQSTLEPVLGPEKFRVAVFADCDLSSSDESEEVFDPQRSVMTTSQKTEEAATNAQAGGVPGTQSALPRPASVPARGNGGVSRRTENMAYQTSRTVRHKKTPQGVVRRVSVSVLLDQQVEWEGRGDQRKKLFVPPEAEQLKSIRDLVAGVVGFNEQRGDQIVVETMPFEMTRRLEPPAEPEKAAPRKPGEADPKQVQQPAWRTYAPPVSAGLIVVFVGGLLFWQWRRGSLRRRRQAALAPQAMLQSSAAPAIAPPAAYADPRIEPEALRAKVGERLTERTDVSTALLKRWMTETTP